MKPRHEHGFSLIELLIVVVVIGVIAAISIPAMRKGMRAAENGAVYATMRTIASAQVNFYANNSRFGRLDELNSLNGRGLGQSVGANQLAKHSFLFEMIPATPTDSELRNGYTILATRQFTGDTTIYQFEVTQSGKIRQILPGPFEP